MTQPSVKCNFLVNKKKVYIITENMKKKKTKKKYVGQSGLTSWWRG